MNKVMVHTLGDSTLDNLYWLINGQATNLDQAMADSVEGQLQTTLGNEYEVISHAYDGFTTQNVLTGGGVGDVLFQGTPKLQAYKNTKLGSSADWVVPLQYLQESIQSNPDTHHYVIISVGGNDFRENLLRPHRLLMDVPHIQHRYLQIVDNVRAMGQNVRPILMFQYRTDANRDPYKIYPILGALAAIILTVQAVAALGIIVLGVAVVAHKVSLVAGIAWILIAATIGAASLRIVPLKAVKGICQGQKFGMTMIGILMEKFYKPMLNYARVNNLPILDLPNTFNPYQAMYISGIEPSKEGAQRIAQGLANIIQRHDYASGGIYWGHEFGAIPQNWQVAYANPHVD